MFRIINIMAVALFIIMAIVIIKYKLVCEITIDGEKLGYIDNKVKFEREIEKIINKEEENKEYTVIEKMPEYKLTLIAKKEKTNEETVLAKIEESSKTTYKLYAVTINGKEKAIVKNLEEAEKLVKELNKKYEKSLKTEVGITEKYTTNRKKNVVSIKKASANITKELSNKLSAQTKNVTTRGNSASTRIKDTTNNTDTEKKEIVSSNKTTVSKVSDVKTSEKTNSNSNKKESTTKSSSTKVKKASSTTKKTSSLNGVKLTVTPVKGIITSRFGSRESIRSRGHTGLDISAPRGTTIKAAAAGTVIFAGYSGGYGKVVKISHGSGIKTYYAHCSKLYVSKGDKVSAGTKIAAVGSTGNSTGNHLHFEVIKNGTKMNPQNYLY